MVQDGRPHPRTCSLFSLPASCVKPGRIKASLPMSRLTIAVWPSDSAYSCAIFCQTEEETDAVRSEDLRSSAKRMSA